MAGLTPGAADVAVVVQAVTGGDELVQLSQVGARGDRRHAADSGTRADWQLRASRGLPTVAKLSQIGADALNKYFGVSPFAKGIPLGVVHITATGTPGPKGSPSAEFLALKGTSTNVDLDAATLKVLTDNKVGVAPVAPATVTGGTASFPIIEGYVAVFPTTDPSYIRGTFIHSGGLKFTAGGKSLEVTDFIVNPGDSTLTATVAGGSAAPIIDLDGSAVKVTQDPSGSTKLDGTVAKLSQVGAEALNKYFGVTLFSKGIVLGVVHVTATGTAAPKG